MEIYMDNDVICGELKINKSLIREIIKLTLEEIHSNKNSIHADNVVRNEEEFNIYKNNDIRERENKQLDFYHKEIISDVVNRIKKLNLNIDIGDENMCFKDLIIRIVDKLVELTDFLREDIEKNNQNHDDEINSCNSKIERLKKELNDEKSKLSALVDKNNKLEKKYEGLNYDKSKLTDQVEKLEIELNNTCKEVKQIFNTIQKIDSKYIDELSPYIRLNKLEPFIVSSAINIDALDKIWRVAKLAAKNNEPETSEIIRKYFEYMVKLFNEAKNEKVVTIDDVNEGEFYNIHDFECIDPNKSYGGIVSKVYLPGFINNYNNKRIEKSLVDIKEN